jgi:hypothetical protein
MIKVAAAFLLLLGSGLIFTALVRMDAPNLRLRPLKRSTLRPGAEAQKPVALRRAA